MHRAALTYRDRLIELFDVLDTLIHEGAAMAEAAHAIADAYTEADAQARTDLTVEGGR
ncbi:hypothetical protein Dvina_09655 [Dactylosporangium vinaceum]|uniref:Uncharacterized protein n=1 Tax=Dactylosporangium vinaceum TaxID=53362 RepID=A0ABV5MB39_9ACTN|nr:hypothetical protein [Dactylosporangium vinaceum]UAB98323.1 hypothetical protein Dvina_09655 [Dactylosporangium vinaceum]